jgi:hypothetical protein
MERCEKPRIDFGTLLQASARDRGLELSKTIGFAFRRRYNLPPTDPRWLSATLEDIYLDVWAHAHTDDPKLRDEVIAEGYDDDLADMERESLALEAKHAARPQVVGEDDWEEVARDEWTDPAQKR